MKKWMAFVIVISILPGLVSLLGGCARKVTPTPTPRFTTPTTTPDWMGRVRSIFVGGYYVNWDADAEYDGIDVYIGLLDADDAGIYVREVTMPVKIEFYSREAGKILY